MRDFNGKVAVITGGASGVGRAIGVRLARAGAKLVLADIEQPALDKTVAELRAAGFDAIGQVTDVAKPEQVEALAARSFDHFGEVHLLFNNAGVGAGGGASLWETSDKAWTWGFNVNFWGVMNGVNAFMPRLLAQNQEAHVVNTSSGVGLLFPPTSGVYSITKAAVIAATEILHMQLTMRAAPVKAALLFPGPYVVETNLFSSARNRPPELTDTNAAAPTVNSLEDMQAMMEKSIGRRIQTSTPEEVAEYAYQALLEDQFWILPMHDRFKHALRERFEGMLALRNPTIPDIM
jgi:NAD(P)-dependent dehydrogenase (short-subunit alcohol dehydrogenase family)